MNNHVNKVVLVVIFAVFTGFVTHTAIEKSPTWDEVGYFGLGTYLLKTWQWDIPAAGSHPPLAYFVHGLPMLFHPFPIDVEIWNAPKHLASDISFLRSADLHRGNALLLDKSLGERWFIISRLLSLLLAVPLFICLAFWSRQIAGSRWPIAVSLAALSPNLVAHSSLITTDLAITASFFIATFCLQNLVQQPTWPRLLLAGCTMGLMLLSKLSALLFFPAGALATAWYVAKRPQSMQALANLIKLRGWMGVSVVAAITITISFTVLWIGYGFKLEPYLVVLRSQLWDLQSGHQSYLMGEISSEGWWYYFLVAIAIKTPVPVMLLAGAGLFCLVRQNRNSGQNLAFMLVPPVFFTLSFVITGSEKNIGLRYLLPIYPFLFLWASAAFGSTCTGTKHHPRWSNPLIGLLMAWMLISTLQIHPHHLAYFNELVGGSKNGHRYLVDSNLDWGQDLKGLKAYCDERGLETIKLSYFGSVDPAVYELNYEWLPSYHLPTQGKTHVDLPTFGTIAISVTNLVGVYMGAFGHGTDLFSWLNQYKPVAHIGHSILIFDIPETAFD